jgi:tripartite ATP-independent transporter DctP family solute receptor
MITFFERRKKMEKQKIYYLLSFMFFFVLIGLPSLTTAAYTGEGQKALVLKSGNEGPVNDIGTQVAIKFAENMKQRTNGKIQITHFANSQLGKWQQMLEAVKTGSIAMMYSPAGGSKDFYITQMPYIFRDRDHIMKVLDGAIREEWSKKHLDKSGIYIFGGLDVGFRHCMFGKVPVRTPADMKGLKFRVPQDPHFIEIFTALGARPTPIPFGELFLALRQGVVDGVDSHLDMIVQTKMWEVQKYLVLTKHMATIFWAHLSGNIWRHLTTETQKVWMDTWNEVCEWAKKEMATREEKNLSLWKSNGGIVIEPDINAFKEATKDVWKKFLKEPEEIEVYQKIKAIH